MRILIIDKNKGWSLFVQEFFHSMAIKVNISEDLSEIQHLVNECDLIFIDSQRFIKDINTETRLINIIQRNKYIVVSVVPNYEEAMYAKSFNAIFYTTKSYNKLELLNLLNKFILKNNYCPIDLSTSIIL